MKPKAYNRSLAQSSDDVVHRLVRERPYLAIAAGAGLGFVLAGGLTAHKTGRMLGAIGSLALFSRIWSRLITTGLSMVPTRRT